MSADWFISMSEDGITTNLPSGVHVTEALGVETLRFMCPVDPTTFTVRLNNQP